MQRPQEGLRGGARYLQIHKRFGWDMQMKKGASNRIGPYRKTLKLQFINNYGEKQYRTHRNWHRRRPCDECSRHPACKSPPQHIISWGGIFLFLTDDS
jgi:hypothetical protein